MSSYCSVITNKSIKSCFYHFIHKYKLEKEKGDLYWYIGQATADYEKECKLSSRTLQSFVEHMEPECQIEKFGKVIKTRNSAQMIYECPIYSQTYHYTNESEINLTHKLDKWCNKNKQENIQPFFANNWYFYEMHFYCLNKINTSGDDMGSYVHLYYVN